MKNINHLFAIILFSFNIIANAATQTELATIQFEDIKNRYITGDTLNIQIKEIQNNPPRLQAADLWVFLKFTDQDLILYFTQTDTDNPQINPEASPFKRNIAPLKTQENSHKVLNMLIPSTLKADFTLYALYMPSNQTPNINKIIFSIQQRANDTVLSNILSTPVTINNDNPCNTDGIYECSARLQDGKLIIPNIELHPLLYPSVEFNLNTSIPNNQTVGATLGHIATPVINDSPPCAHPVHYKNPLLIFTFLDQNNNCYCAKLNYGANPPPFEINYQSAHNNVACH